MKQRSIMLKPASGLCNMRCNYCFYADLTRRRSVPSYGAMTGETARRVVDSACAGLERGDRLSLAFQGGEPTLAGLGFFQDLCAYVKEAHPGVEVAYALQTNGLLLSEEWVPLLKEHRFLVGLSMDATGEFHDQNRKDAAGLGTHKRVMETKRLLEKHGVPYNILTVLTNQLARHPKGVWSFLVKEGVDYVQFIPCLDELEHGEKSPYALTPERFYRFYSGLFPLWADAMAKGKYISVKLFDDLVNLYLRREVTACGITGQCAVQFVVEGDGTVFPCDFYMVDQFRMGSMAEETPETLYERGIPFLTYGQEYKGEAPCRDCRYFPSCGGGCKRMRESMYLQDGACWYQKLLDEILEPLLRIGSRFV